MEAVTTDGCCHCTDCGGDDSTAPCFWDVYNPRNKLTLWAAAAFSDAESGQEDGGDDSDDRGNGNGGGHPGQTGGFRGRAGSANFLRKLGLKKPFKKGASRRSTSTATTSSAADGSPTNSGGAPSGLDVSLDPLGINADDLDVQLQQQLRQKKKRLTVGPLSSSGAPPPARGESETPPKSPGLSAAQRKHLRDLEARAGALQQEVGVANQRADAALQQLNHTRMGMSDQITRLEAEVSVARRERDEARAVMAAGLASARSSMSSLESTRAATAAVLTSFSTAVRNVRAPLLAEKVPEQWQGKGSPYMAHLTRSVHVITPYLVQAFLGATKPTVPVMCGAAAWGPYLDYPLHTEDLDFFVALPRDTIHSALLTACSAVTQLPDVSRCLAVLDTVAAIHGDWQWTGEEDADVRAAKHHRVRQAEAVKPDGQRKYGMTLRITPSDAGWTVQLGHHAILDVCPLGEADKEALCADPPAPAYLDTVLPTRLVHNYDVDLRPVVQVASVPMLIKQLARSLNSGDSWRLQKDIPRLRYLSHTAWIQHQCGGGVLSASMESWQALLARFDPAWLTVMVYSGQMMKQLTGQETLLPGRAMSRAGSQSDLSQHHHPHHHPHHSHHPHHPQHHHFHRPMQRSHSTTSLPGYVMASSPPGPGMPTAPSPYTGRRRGGSQRRKSRKERMRRLSCSSDHTDASAVSETPSEDHDTAAPPKGPHQEVEKKAEKKKGQAEGKEDGKAEGQAGKQEKVERQEGKQEKPTVRLDPGLQTTSTL